MESSDSAPSIPFKSKKAALHVTPKKSAKQWGATDRMVLETPEKPSQPLPRIRNQNFALSRKDVKKKILSLHQRELNGSELDSIGKLGLDLDRPEKVAEEEARRLRVGGGDKGKSGEGSIKLPEKYDKLCEFFNSMVGVIPLLRMRRMSLTFSNICPKVESLTDRRFTLTHLAQLKYILPEAIVVKKIRVRDEQTDCIKEELHITLDRDALKSDGNGKELRVIFRDRVEDYHKLHSMDDVPEGELPALFYEPKPQEKLSNPDQGPVLVTASHVSPCFQRSFSRKGPKLEGTLELQTRPHVSESSLGLPPNEKAGCFSEVEESSSASASVVELPTFRVPMSPVRDTNFTATNNGKKTSTDCHATPVKDASTPTEIMTSTPATQSLKRCMMSPDDDKTEMPTKLVRRPQRSRSLKFDLPVEENSSLEEHKDMTVTGSSVDMDLLDLLPENLLQSVREKERKNIEEQDPAISQAKRRQQLMSGVPKLLDVIHLLFQSINRSVVTKDELLYRVVANHCDIVDKGEIEEQLRLLLELAPEYISERMCSSGDILVCLNKTASAQSVRAKLLKA